jgi:hypothetical protein
MPTNSTTPPSARVLLGCSKCGASLPDEAQFCLKCGKPVSIPPKFPAVVEAEALPVDIRQPRRRGPMIVGVALALLAAFLLWTGISDSTAAQEVQEFVGWKHDRVILDGPFSVGPHTFRYYKFALPEGSVNVSVMGQFASSANTPGGGKRVEGNDNDIEVYILSDSAFTVWQNGYATSSLYESGKVAAGSVQAEVPAGAGIYYLVFSNRAALKTPKSVHSTVLLRYKSWLPEWFRLMKGRMVDWVGAS